MQDLYVSHSHRERALNPNDFRCGQRQSMKPKSHNPHPSLGSVVYVSIY